MSCDRTYLVQSKVMALCKVHSASLDHQFPNVNPIELPETSCLLGVAIGKRIPPHCTWRRYPPKLGDRRSRASWHAALSWVDLSFQASEALRVWRSIEAEGMRMCGVACIAVLFPNCILVWIRRGNTLTHHSHPYGMCLHVILSIGPSGRYRAPCIGLLSRK